jgi:hypothetical protein
MARYFSNTFQQVTVSAAQDLVTGYFNTHGSAFVTRVFLNCALPALATAAILPLRCTVLTNISLGSGGTSTGAYNQDIGDTTAGLSCHQNDTTLSTAGTLTERIWEGGCYLYTGLDLTFTEPIPVCAAGTSIAFCFSLLSVPSYNITLSGGMEWFETGQKGS